MRISEYQMQRRRVIVELESRLTDTIGQVFDDHPTLSYFELMSALVGTMNRWVQHGLRDEVNEDEAISLLNKQAITLAKTGSSVSLTADSPEDAETLFNWLESLTQK